MVELANMHCFQTQLNLEYIGSLVETAPDPGEQEKTVSFCSPTLNGYKKTMALSSLNSNNNTFWVTTESLDFRILGNIQGEDTPTGRKFAGFAYGSGFPQISVVDCNGTTLKNGYHRAYALLKKRHKFLPCLSLTADIFQPGSVRAQGSSPTSLIISNRSPVLSDFETDAASPVPRRRVRQMASIHAEVQVVPV